MRMGNFLRAERIYTVVMAARRQTLGIQHRTVVPTNFEQVESMEDGVDEHGQTRSE